MLKRVVAIVTSVLYRPEVELKSHGECSEGEAVMELACITHFFYTVINSRKPSYGRTIKQGLNEFS
jgi:hypothetical protein